VKPSKLRLMRQGSCVCQQIPAVHLPHFLTKTTGNVVFDNGEAGGEWRRTYYIYHVHIYYVKQHVYTRARTCKRTRSHTYSHIPLGGHH